MNYLDVYEKTKESRNQVVKKNKFDSIEKNLLITACYFIFNNKSFDEFYKVQSHNTKTIEYYQNIWNISKEIYDDNQDK